MAAMKNNKGSKDCKISYSDAHRMDSCKESKNQENTVSGQIDVKITENEEEEEEAVFDVNQTSYYTCWWDQDGYLGEGWRRISRWRELQLLQEEQAWRMKYGN